MTDLIKQKFLAKIISEMEYSREKFPAFHSHHEAYAVIKEEFDELWDDIKLNRTNEKKLQETVQIIAMCFCYIQEVLDK